VFLAGENFFFKFFPILGTPLTPQQNIEYRSKHSYLDFHSVREHTSKPLVFQILSFQSRAILTSNKVLGALGLSQQKFDTFLSRRAYKCSSEMEQMQWIVILNRLIQQAWQQLFEKSFILSPEMYQCRAFVMKFNQRGKGQERCLVLSDTWIYNVEVSHNPTAIKDLKWAFPIAALSAIVFSRSSRDTVIGNDDDEDELTVISTSAAEASADDPYCTLFFDQAVFKKYHDNKHAGTKKTKFNDSHKFVFSHNLDMLNIVQELHRLFFLITGTHIKIEEKELFNQSELEVAGESPIIKGVLVKFTHGGGKKHERVVSVYPSCKIMWRESEKTKVHLSQVLAVWRGTGDLKKRTLSSEEASRLFTVQTAAKTLQLLTLSSADRDRWVDEIQKLIS